MMADQPQPQTPPRQVGPEPLPPVLSLTEAAHLDPTQARALLGTKAASLARLAGAGFPVPPGVVVTGAAAANWDQAYARLHAAAAELGDPEQRFAVRSSATAEDLAGASFAGQYETVLDVGLDELPEAVRQVVDSAASARVAAYRQAHPQAVPADPPGSGGGMAVLVQVMVPADAAGVAFTANPLTGDRDEVVISAVPGLGERLVAGQATGDQWTLATVVPRLASAISAMTAPVAVVMDHLELLDNQECLDAVAELAVRSRQAPSWCWPPDARHPCRWRFWAPRARWSRSGPTSWPWTSRRPERCWRVQGPG